MPAATISVDLFARGGGVGFRVPVATVDELGEGRKRVPVLVTINAHTYQSTIATYGGEHFIGVSKANRGAAGVDVGDTINVTLTRDDAPRVVEVPEDLAAALRGDEAAAAAFEKLSYTHRREYVQWVTEAKRDATRARRVVGALERLKTGRTAR